MAICFDGADINPVLTWLMNPPPDTNLYANCHGNSGISHFFLLFMQLQSTAAINNTWRKIPLCGSLCHPDTPVLKVQASFPSVQLQKSLCLSKLSCNCRLHKQNTMMKTGNLANSFIRRVFHPCSLVLGAPWIMQP